MSGWLNQTPASYAQALSVCFPRCEDERTCKEPHLSVLSGLLSNAGDSGTGRLFISCPAPYGFDFLGPRGNLCPENFESKNPVLAKQSSSQGLKVCVCREGLGARGECYREEILKQPNLVDIGQQYPQTFFWS